MPAQPLSRTRVWLDERAEALILAQAAKRPRTETGGALFGYADGDELVIACAYGPGPRAKHRRTTFEPHPATTDLLIDAVRAESQGRYRYLGSWHTHPGGRARPSGTDVETSERVASEPAVQLPEPLVLIQATSANGRVAKPTELRAWRWSAAERWLLPCAVERCRLAERWCPRPRRFSCWFCVPHLVA